MRAKTGVSLQSSALPTDLLDVLLLAAPRPSSWPFSTLSPLIVSQAGFCSLYRPPLSRSKPCASLSFSNPSSIPYNVPRSANTAAMGNGPSKEAPDAPQDEPSKHHDHGRKPRRRESVGVLPLRTVAAPPSANLDTASGKTSSNLSSQPLRTAHTRQRSQTSIDRTIKPLPHESFSQPQDVTKLRDQPSSLPQPISASRSPTHTSPPAAPHPADPAINAHDSTQSGSAPATSYYHASQYGRPPRLPLPIQEEVLSPGSPIISPADFGVPETTVADDVFPRNPSMLSSTTMDDEEQGELGDEFRDPAHKDAPLIETLIIWRHGGESVYVTGSFSRWNKKWRLSRADEDPNIFFRVLPLPVGTHHITFIVDGEMRRASDLPTAVDYTNYLVNYIEVHLDEHGEGLSAESSKQVTPQPTPGVEKTATEALSSGQQAGAPGNARDTSADSSGDAGTSSIPKRQVAKRAETKAYHSVIPRFLADLDEPEDSGKFQRAGAVLGTQPAPPALPMFLNKSILNGATPMKDDASVLIMPNHTVLNHLATSSIKNNVLATSATTRYKRKVCNLPSH